MKNEPCRQTAETSAALPIRLRRSRIHHVSRSVVAFGLLVLSTAAVGGRTTANAASKTSSNSAASLSFSCSWTEPFDQMEMSKGQVAYSFSGDKAELMLTPSIVKTGSKVSVRGSLAGKNFEMRITNVAFTESEEESTVPYSVSILGGEGSVNGGKGGCIRYADGTAPLDVIGVADNDVLNIRTKPNSRASILGTAYPRGRVWIYPRSNAGGWIKVSFYRFAESKSKRGLVTGWVNAKFLAKT